MICWKCQRNIFSSVFTEKQLFYHQVRGQATKWMSSTFDLTVHNDKHVVHTYQLELGEAVLPTPSPGSPCILAVHPSGSSYKQWSPLSNIIQPGSCSGLFGLNMFGYGLSDRWNIDHRKQTIQDQVAMVTAAVTASDRADVSWHLIGHSMGAGSVLATAASQSDLSDKLESVTVFEPNLFSLLQVGNPEEQRLISDGDIFFKEMMEAASVEDWDLWGRLFYKFWFDGRWDSLDEGAKKVLLHTTIPHTVHEIQSVKSAIDQGPGIARKMMDTLSGLKCRKRMVVSAEPGIGSKEILNGLGDLLRREAGFEILQAPLGGHMGPVTHRDVVLHLLLV